MNIPSNDQAMYRWGIIKTGMELKDTLFRYAQFVSWLLADSLKGCKKLSAAILISGFLGVIFKLQVFGLLIYYAQHLSSGETIKLLGQTFDPRSSLFLLAASSLAVVALLLISALCIYFSRRNIVRLSRRYEEFCSKRVFYLLGQNMNLFASQENIANGDTYLFRLVKSDSRFAGRVLYMLLALLVPGLTMTAAVAVLFYLEFVLTLLIAVCALGFTYSQFRISRAAAKHSMLFEKLSPAAGQELKGLIQYYKQQPQSAENRDMVENLFATNPVKRELDAYEGRLQVVESSRLVSGIFMAVVLGLILIIIGSDIILTGTGWGRLLVYVLALRFAMTNLQIAFGQLTSINRFYPQVRRYFLFVQSIQHQKSEQYPVQDVYQVRLGWNSPQTTLSGSAKHIILKPGTRLALVSALELNRYTMAALSSVLLGQGPAFQGALHSTRFVSFRHSCPMQSLRQLLQQSHQTKWQDLFAWLPSEELRQQAEEQLPQNLDRVLNHKLWANIDPNLKFVLSFLSALQSDNRFIFMEAKGLRLLWPEEASYYLELSQDRIVVIVFNSHIDKVGSFAEDAVTVTGEEGLWGLGTVEWFASVRKEAERLLGKSTRQAESEVEDIDTLLEI